MTQTRVSALLCAITLTCAVCTGATSAAERTTSPLGLGLQQTRAVADPVKPVVASPLPTTAPPVAAESSDAWEEPQLLGLALVGLLFLLASRRAGID